MTDCIDKYVPTAPVLITGACGKIGSILTKAFSSRGWTLLLTDRAEYPGGEGAVPAGCKFFRADFAEEEGVRALEEFARGCKAIVHMGAISSENTFEKCLHSNIVGTHRIYELARALGAGVVYASSYHAFGFYPRAGEKLDISCALRPDGEYGLSKVYCESLAELCWLKHAVASVVVRIGSCCAAPKDWKSLATYISPDDMAALVACAVRALTGDDGRAASAEPVGCLRVWACSNNARSYWTGDAAQRARLGWAPRDSSDAFETPELAAKRSDDPLVEHYQGANVCALDNQHRILL